MTMTKKERTRVEELLTLSSLFRTTLVLPDVPPPVYSSGITTGWAHTGGMSDHTRVVVACSSSGSHSIGRDDKTTSQRSRSLFSTKTLALHALRHEVEMDCCRRLRRIDLMIEHEAAN